MSAVTTIDDDRQLSPAQSFRRDLDRMTNQFAMALPSHIKPEKFQRVVMTAVLSDPSILNADRKSLMESAIRAAQDGLLPDKREGAFVVFNTKVNNAWVKAVQWMPMIGGVIKRIHQSGEVSTITAKVVFGGDTFRSWIDDEGEHVSYEQAELPDYDTIRQVFAMAKMKDGSIYVETLTPRDIEKIRSVSRSKDSGPWTTWWEEMAKKSAIRRLSKRLPLSTEIHDLIARDDALYDLSRAPDPRPSLSSRLAAGSLTEGREGFDRGLIERHDETRPAPSSPEPDTEQAAGTVPDRQEATGDNSPASELSTDDVGKTDAIDPDAPADEHEDAVTSRESEATGAAADGPRELDGVFRLRLCEAAQKLLEITTASGLDPKGMQEAVAMALPAWKDHVGAEQHERLRKVVKRVNDVIAGKSNLAAAVARIAAELGAKPTDVEPAKGDRCG